MSSHFYRDKPLEVGGLRRGKGKPEKVPGLRKNSREEEEGRKPRQNAKATLGMTMSSFKERGTGNSWKSGAWWGAVR